MFRRCALVVTYLLSAAVCVQTKFQFKCSEKEMRVSLSSVCDGKVDCPHGSDETNILCKPESLVNVNTFKCGYGGIITDKMKCNGVVECADKSDESPRLCQEDSVFNKTRRGKCKEYEFECMLGECLPVGKMCNNQHDCSNGWDESVETCMIKCEDAEFQCGNGNCIDKTLKCDNNFDCIDGSDELESVCEEYTNWQRKSPLSCVEPVDKGLRFTGDTKYHVHQNQTRFVYANYMVKFECNDKDAYMPGSQWNVCTYTGEWRNNLMACKSSVVNNDPKTNGSLGCPINKYDKKLMLINEWKNRKLLQAVEPPINNMTVKFSCTAGYTLLPRNLTNNPIRCWNKTWNKKFTDPHCVKLCSPKRLHCSDSMNPVCTLNSMRISCNAEGNNLFPGTTAKFYCRSGYRQNESMSDMTLKCLDDGTWSSNPNMDKFCELDCGIMGDKKINPLSSGAYEIRPDISPWTVAIYMRNINSTTFQRNCTGVRVKPNIVLTAAHCVTLIRTKYRLHHNRFRVGSSTSQLQFFNHSYGWPVLQVKINPEYDPVTLNADTALLQLNLSRDEEYTHVICLPWEVNFDAGILTTGGVYTWAENSTNKAIQLTMVLVSTSNPKGDINMLIKTKLNQKICKGDSGSGFSTSCYKISTEPMQSCLYGIVSYADSGIDNDSCALEIKATNITHYQNRGFLEREMQQMYRTCN